ncbi:hypothetical protein Pint_26951 [Pistacia integerrima]|uniref:Uncharacterized protein n=1 Tax=Pistacia integerrima TaxID=434235 RepID=A0ACC0YSC1_9ROSI|nr:hypothetical protein Pint_26951 [Pistacia integerrima]
MVAMATSSLQSRRKGGDMGYFRRRLWAQFRPNECEDFDEALSKVKQVGSLRGYQKEFEKLGNRVQEWTQKALVGTFMGGLKPEIADSIRMLKPKSLKEKEMTVMMMKLVMSRPARAEPNTVGFEFEFFEPRKTMFVFEFGKLMGVRVRFEFGSFAI